MSHKAVLAQELKDLEAELCYWVVEAISIERGIDNMEVKIDSYETELGPERSAEFRMRLTRARASHRAIEEGIESVRLRLEDLRVRLNKLS